MEEKKGFQIFYIFPILYVVSVYLLPVLFVKSTDDAMSLIKYLPVLFGILNIIVSVKYCKPQNRIMMLNAVILVKYAMIPFFLIGGLAVAASFLLSFIPVPFMIFLGPMLSISGAIIGWLILAFESPYVISYLCLSAKAGIRLKLMAAVHSILQFFFMIDVIDVMILTLKEHKWKKLTIAIIVLFASVAILFFLLIVLAIIMTLINIK